MCGNISSLRGNTSVKKMKRSVGNERVSVSVSVSASASETRRTRRTSVVRNRMMEHGGRGSGSMSTMWSCCQRNYYCGGVRRNKDDVRLMRTRTFAATPAPTPPLSSPPFSSPPIQSPPSTTSISSSSFPSGFLQPVMRSPITSNRSNLKQDLDQYFKGILNAKVYDVAVESPLEYAPSLSYYPSSLSSNAASDDNDSVSVNESRHVGGGHTVLLKREDKQQVFSFKLRGAYNMIKNLDKEELNNGVICSSAGNHAQGVALAAKMLGISAIIAMPTTTPKIKVDSVRLLGAHVELIGEAYDECEAWARKTAAEQHRRFIPPFDDPLIIQGQGTVGMEILRQVNSGQELDAIFVPVGGGGLIAGIASYVKQLRPNIKVIGVEPFGASAMADSLRLGERVTLEQVDKFADGVAVKRVGQETFEMCRALVDGVVCVTNSEICAAVKDIFTSTRSLVEPSGALALAGLKAYRSYYNNDIGASSSTYCAIVSGANVNFDRLRVIAELANVGQRSSTTGSAIMLDNSNNNNNASYSNNSVIAIDTSVREFIFATKIPEKKGSFLQFMRIVSAHDNNNNADSMKTALPCLDISEFRYRLSLGASEAVVLYSITVSNQNNEGINLVRNMKQHLEGNGMDTVDCTDDELVVTHLKHLAGGLGVIQNNVNNTDTNVGNTSQNEFMFSEQIFSFEFPERPGALIKFLETICPTFNITLFHYRNEGSRDASCLIGIEVNGDSQLQQLQGMIKGLGDAYSYNIETGHSLLSMFTKNK